MTPQVFVQTNLTLWDHREGPVLYLVGRVPSRNVLRASEGPSFLSVALERAG